MRVAVLLLAATPLAAQEPRADLATTAKTGLILDAYSFGSGFAFDNVVEWTVPVTVSHHLGPRLTVDLSAAFARASGATTSGTFLVSGLTDTDVRASWATVSGHLIISVAGTLPTGQATVSDSSVPLLSALATDLLAFTTPTLGTGGGATGGFATAFPLGERWAGGVAGSYRWHAGYTPVSGGGRLEPGGEGRVRIGVEGPLGAGGGGYVRAAAVYTASGADTTAGSAATPSGSRSGIGDRILVYSSVSLPAGAGSLVFYAYDMYRLRPRGLTATDSTTVQVPRGNVFALGARLERTLSPALGLAPNVEFRSELTGASAGSLTLLGWLVRPGVDLRYRASGRVTLLVQGQTAFGRLANGNGGSVALVGPRAVVLVDVTR